MSKLTHKLDQLKKVYALLGIQEMKLSNKLSVIKREQIELSRSCDVIQRNIEELYDAWSELRMVGDFSTSMDEWYTLTIKKASDRLKIEQQLSKEKLQQIKDIEKTFTELSHRMEALQEKIKKTQSRILRSREELRLMMVEERISYRHYEVAHG